MSRLIEGLKDYLDAEHDRNLAQHETIHRLLHRAVGDCHVSVAHHIIFGKTEESIPNELPSIDTLFFDHDLMTKVFGDEAKRIMVVLASRPAEFRDGVVKDFLDNLDKAEVAPVSEVKSMNATPNYV